jgi:hypothetical protein
MEKSPASFSVSIEILTVISAVSYFINLPKAMYLVETPFSIDLSHKGHSPTGENVVM